MRAIDRTTAKFVEACKVALPGVPVRIQRSLTAHGRSNYVYIDVPRRVLALKVRISDHPVGMRRALSGAEQLYLHHLATPDHWSVWLSEMRRLFLPKAA